MSIETLGVYELLEKDLKPGDIVTHRTYGPNASIPKGTLIGLIGEQATVDWWTSTRESADQEGDSLWDGTDVAKIVSITKNLLYTQCRMHDKDIARRLSLEASSVTRLQVRCTSTTFEMSYKGVCTKIQFDICIWNTRTELIIIYNGNGNMENIETHGIYT